MPNIIINNYCNQKCSYCFAYNNMQKSLKKEMNIKTYLLILKYLKYNNDNNVRILGGEPFLFKNIRKFLLLAQKGGFNIIVFSNLNISNDILKKILKGIKNIKINININNRDFYTKREIKKIKANISYLKKKNIHIILGYNIINVNIYPDLFCEIINEFEIKNILLKITNSLIEGKLIINNTDRKLGIYIYDLIQKYYKFSNIEIGCGLDKRIFSEKELSFIKNNTNINLRFGCNGNIGKFDINTDGSLIRCFVLSGIREIKIFVEDLLYKKIEKESIVNIISKGFFSGGECIGNKIIKKGNIN